MAQVGPPRRRNRPRSLTTQERTSQVHTTNFHATITHTDGSTSEARYTEAEAFDLLGRVLRKRRGFHVEATRAGGVIITRDVYDGGITPKRHTLALESAAQPVTKLSAQTRMDLETLVDHHGQAFLAQGGPNDGRICASLYGIPPGATRKLIERGLVTVGDELPARERGNEDSRRPVAVSLVARLAMIAQDHRTSTRQPNGYVRPSDIGRSDAGLNKPGGRCGKVYDRTSSASCSCRWSEFAEDRDDARRRAREHRRQATAAMLRTLAPMTHQPH